MQNTLSPAFTFLIALFTTSTAAQTNEYLDQYKRGYDSAMVQVFCKSGGVTKKGSGFFVSKSGYILTALHNVRTRRGQECEKLTIRIGSGQGREVIPDIAKTNLEIDSALLKIDGRLVNAVIPLSLGDNVNDEDFIISMGFRDTSLVEGVIGALRQKTGRLSYPLYENTNQRVNLTDAWIVTNPINPGDSGGPIIDRDGFAVGMIVAAKEDQNLVSGVIPIAIIQAERVFDRARIPVTKGFGRNLINGVACAMFEGQYNGKGVRIARRRCRSNYCLPGPGYRNDLSLWYCTDSKKSCAWPETPGFGYEDPPKLYRGKLFKCTNPVDKGWAQFLR